MSNTWISLAWKEWHEHKWKLAAMLGVLLGVTSLVILQERGRDRFGLAIGMLFMCSVPMGAFIGLGAAANERSRSTLPFLQALPVPMWRVAVLKLLFGFITIIAAVALTAASFSVWMWVLDFFGVHYTAAILVAEPSGPLFATGYWQIDVVLYCITTVGSIFIWAAAMGVNRKDEVNAGVAALAVIIGLWVLFILVIYTIASALRWPNSIADWLLPVAFSGLPGGFVVLYDKSRLFIPLAICILIVIAVHSALVARYIRRFGQVADIGNRSPHVAVPNPYDWLRPPRSTIAVAIGWKQLRESGPIALVGLLGIIGTAVFMYALELSRDVLGQTYAAAAIYLGFVIALVAGIGVALNDCEPRLNTFWRTRPIGADLWFGIKFLTGLSIVVAAIYVPLRLIGGELPQELWLQMPALHLATFAAAIATTCIVRHAIYAAILSMGVLTACIAGAWLAWDWAKYFGWTELDTAIYSPFENQSVVLAGSGVCFVVSTIAAWLAMRNDWGWKSRY